MAEDIGAQSRLLVSRKQAKLLGLPRYCTGKPCKHGHLCERYVAGGACAECIRVLLTAKRRARGVPEWKPAMSREMFLGKRRVLNVAWKSRNRERLAAKARAYYQANKAVCNARARAYYLADPWKILKSVKAYRARRRGAAGRFTKADVDDLMRLQRGRCGYCTASIRRIFHIDHIRALAKGGTNFRSNLQLLCPTCNLQKSDLDPLVWARRRGRLL